MRVASREGHETPGFVCLPSEDDEKLGFQEKPVFQLPPGVDDPPSAAEDSRRSSIARRHQVRDVWEDLIAARQEMEERDQEITRLRDGITAYRRSEGKLAKVAELLQKELTERTEQVEKLVSELDAKRGHDVELQQRQQQQQQQQQEQQQQEQQQEEEEQQLPPRAPATPSSRSSRSARPPALEPEDQARQEDQSSQPRTPHRASVSSRGSHRMSLHQAEWQVRQENRWQDLSGEACRLLAEAQEKGLQTVQLTSGVVKYEIDLKAMTQTNLKTKRKREVRRVLPSELSLQGSVSNP